MLSVSNTPFILCVVMRNVIVLSVLALSRKVQITVVYVLTVTLYQCKHDLRFNQGTLTEWGRLSTVNLIIKIVERKI
jgi:hypothetical protein